MCLSKSFWEEIFTLVKKQNRLIYSNGFKNILVLFNTFSARLSASMKMMMMKLNKIHFVICLDKDSE
jgi:hypothetical protein